MYDIATDRWSTLPHPLGTPATAIASDGVRWIYFALDGAIVRYDPASTRVERIAVPLSIGRDGDLHYLDGWLYGHAGQRAPRRARRSSNYRVLSALTPGPSGSKA